ncbi:MAG: type VI secretion system tip protein TssI/VgrG [Enhygromyxa sp.]
MTVADEQPVTLRFECEQSEARWEVSGLQLSEAFNQPYELRLELRSDDPGAEASEMLGQPISLWIERGSSHRELCGIVEAVEDGVYDQEHTIAALSVVPALMALGQRRNSRIFSDMTIPDILSEVLEAGLGPYQRELDISFLTGSYPVQEYTVQYQETDLDFVHRLLEEYGIGYCFRHEGGAETLVLFDSDSAYVLASSHGNDDGTLPMVLAGGSPGMREDVREFQRESKLRPTVARTMVFDWLAPAELLDDEDDEVAELDSVNGAELEPEREDYEHAEPSTLSGYRSEGLDFAAVQDQVKLRRKLHQRDAIRFTGLTTATQLSPGMKFELLEHPNPDLDREYLVVAVEHAAGEYASSSIPGESYTNRIECIPAEVEWRPDRRTRRPRISSIQTATVVGPAGEEIHTDEHGRIKVQFHWDRRKLYSEEASCFVRVVQPWAGNGWGFVWLPRIGMEVAVTFVDGDPDRPIVTGCLYNGDRRPPYPLPDDKTKSTIKSESSPGGGGFNELRFEDAAGSEEIYIHAQKDFNEVVLNDHNTTVGNNQTNNVDVDQTQTVHGNQSEAVDGNQDMTVGGNRTVHVKGDFEETVDGTETRTVTGDVTEDFAANETRTIAANQDETISGNVTHTISGNQTDTISGSLSETITGGITTTTPANLNVTAAGGINMTTSGAMLVTAVGGFTVLAPGGTKTVDQDFWSFGGGQGSIFGFQIGIAASKVDLTGIAVGHTNIKLEHTGMSIGFTTAAYANEPAKIDSVGAAVMQGYASLHTFGLLSIL